MSKKPIRVGIGGPVGSGKSTLCLTLCRHYGKKRDMAVITNDIYTKEDARMLIEASALPEERILGVETGGCPHTNKAELAPYVEVDLESMHADCFSKRSERPFFFTDLKTGREVDELIAWFDRAVLFTDVS